MNYRAWLAWLVAMPLGMQAVVRSIPASGTFLREDLVMNIFLRPFFLFGGFKSFCFFCLFLFVFFLFFFPVSELYLYFVV